MFHFEVVFLFLGSIRSNFTNEELKKLYLQLMLKAKKHYNDMFKAKVEEMRHTLNCETSSDEYYCISILKDLKLSLNRFMDSQLNAIKSNELVLAKSRFNKLKECVINKLDESIADAQNGNFYYILIIIIKLTYH